MPLIYCAVSDTRANTLTKDQARGFPEHGAHISTCGSTSSKVLMTQTGSRCLVNTVSHRIAASNCQMGGHMGLCSMPYTVHKAVFFLGQIICLVMHTTNAEDVKQKSATHCCAIYRISIVGQLRCLLRPLGVVLPSRILF